MRRVRIDSREKRPTPILVIFDRCLGAGPAAGDQVGDLLDGAVVLEHGLGLDVRAFLIKATLSGLVRVRVAELIYL